METIVELKNENEELEVEYEVICLSQQSLSTTEQEEIIDQDLALVDEQLLEIEKKLDILNSDINRLTNNSDGLDYMLAVGSGIVAGIVDIFFVGEVSLDQANEWGNEKTNKFVIKIAQTFPLGKGYKGSELAGAVKHLEKCYVIAADKATNDFGGGYFHHLRDFSHHPTLVGLFFSMLTQFTGKVYGTDVAGKFMITELKSDDLVLVGKNLPEKISFGVIKWFLHMVSDMAGSSGSIDMGKVGTGLPGPVVSLLKELSVLPIFKKLDKDGHKEFSVWISKLFDGTLLGERNKEGKLLSPVKFDLRTEIGIYKQQSVPVIINECIVRCFYFIRRLYMEISNNKIKNISGLKLIDWKNTLPVKNRTVSRMLTISTGTMMSIDLADAAIESAIKSGGASAVFWKNMIVNVNFVGIGRFALAVKSDVGMGRKREKVIDNRIKLFNSYISLMNIKVYYKQAEAWHMAESTEKAIEESYLMIQKTAENLVMTSSNISRDLDKIESHALGVKENNPGLIDDIINCLKENDDKMSTNNSGSEVKELQKHIKDNFDNIISLKKDIKLAKEKADNIKSVTDDENNKKIGVFKTRKILETMQNNMKELAEGQYASAELHEKMLDYQKNLAEISQGIIVLQNKNITMKETVIKELEKRLDVASREELDEESKSELLDFVEQLKSGNNGSVGDETMNIEDYNEELNNNEKRDSAIKNIVDAIPSDIKDDLEDIVIEMGEKGVEEGRKALIRMGAIEGTKKERIIIKKEDKERQKEKKRREKERERRKKGK